MCYILPTFYASVFCKMKYIALCKQKDRGRGGGVDRIDPLPTLRKIFLTLHFFPIDMIPVRGLQVWNF